MSNTVSRYGTLPIAFHWLTLLLLIAVYACIELREFFPKGSDPRNALKSWHFMLGITVLWITGLRLIARWLSPTPAPDSRVSHIQYLMAKLMHITLYIFLLAMPLLGWATLSGEGKAVMWFGWELPALIMPDKALADELEEIHGTLGTVGYFLIGAHALVGLYHHYIQGDSTLLRMLPERR